jgi:hypothetical protein
MASFSSQNFGRDQFSSDFHSTSAASLSSNDDSFSSSATFSSASASASSSGQPHQQQRQITDLDPLAQDELDIARLHERLRQESGGAAQSAQSGIALFFIAEAFKLQLLCRYPHKISSHSNVLDCFSDCIWTLESHLEYFHVSDRIINFSIQLQSVRQSQNRCLESTSHADSSASA